MRAPEDSPRSASLERWAVGLWLTASTLFLLGLISLALRFPGVPLRLGLLDQPGASAIWTLLAAGICGAAAEVALLQHRLAIAAALSLGYSVFWLVVLVGGMAQAASRTTMGAVFGHAWGTWIVGGTIYFTMLGGFLLTAHWSVEQLRD